APDRPAMTSTRLLSTTDLSGVSPVRHQGRAVGLAYAEIAAALDQRAPGLGSLFAEPVFGAATRGGFKNASWYTPLEGEPVSFGRLPPAARATAEQKLAARLTVLRPLLDDSRLGPALCRALLVPSLDHLQLVDGNPVLVDWGFVPEGTGEDDAALAAHFRATLGPLAGWELPLDPAAAPAPPGAAKAAAFAAVEPPPFASRPPPPPPPGPPPVMVMPPAGRGPSRLWLLPAALACVLLGLLFGLWAARHNAATVIVDPDRMAVQQGVLEALRGERDRLRGAVNSGQCKLPPGERPGAALTLPPLPTQPLPAAPLPQSLPPAASVPPGTTPPNAPKPATPPQPPAQPSTLSLNEILERSTVMLIAGESLGSGFFVAPGLILTNRHVVEGKKGLAGTIIVISKSLGHALPATVVATSPNSEIGGRDYALLQVAPPPGAQSLPLATGVEKRVTVIAAGFPGHLIKSDPAVQALAKGDPTAAPELVMSEGKVEVIHTHQNGIPIVVHSADISQGNSGGPLVDRCGRVVGINTFIDTDPQSGRRGLYSLGSADLIAFLTAQNAPVRVDTATCPPSGS
ncbi:MAG: trypsin-like peptidase domain-containing protein, partial [Rhodospirillaceae bacterium]